MNELKPSFEAQFSNFAGQLAESISLNRSLGQIYGLLYLQNQPLSLDEIAQRLSMSKGNASLNLRTLESWKAVRSVAIQGSRRDHYQANRNIKEIALKRIEEGVSKRIELCEESLNQISNEIAEGTDENARA